MQGNEAVSAWKEAVYCGEIKLSMRLPCLLFKPHPSLTLERHKEKGQVKFRTPPLKRDKGRE